MAITYTITITSDYYCYLHHYHCLWLVNGNVHCQVDWSPWLDRILLLPLWWRWTQWQSMWSWTPPLPVVHTCPPVWCIQWFSDCCQCRLLMTPGRWSTFLLVLGKQWPQSGETLDHRWNSPHRYRHLHEGNLNFTQVMKFQSPKHDRSRTFWCTQSILEKKERRKRL